MEEYTFYYPDGSKIANKEEFIKFYSRMYYYVDHNFALEAEMEKLLKRKSNCKLKDPDIDNILLWKTSGTLKDGIIITRYNQINTDNVHKAYKAWSPECQENSYHIKDDSYATLVKNLCNVDGIGRVIAITILYYESCGKYPIYDRFADIAVQIIFNESPFTENLYDRSLNNTTATRAKSIYDEYNTNLKKIFKNCYIDTDRDIDRALWVYGHMFSKNKTNQKKEEEFPKFKEWRHESAG